MKFFKWLEPLIAEKESDGLRYASKGRVAFWIVFLNDLFVVWYILTAKKEITHIELVLGFLEALTVALLGYVFAGKTIVNKQKFGVFAGNGDEIKDANQDDKKV